MSAGGRLGSRVSAHELAHWRVRTPEADADADSKANASAYELRPDDTLLCFDALLASYTARSPRRLLFDSPALSCFS